MAEWNALRQGQRPDFADLLRHVIAKDDSDEVADLLGHALRLDDGQLAEFLERLGARVRESSVPLTAAEVRSFLPDAGFGA